MIETIPDPLPSWLGPRWWWHGPLDVEGLALGSALAMATALSAESRCRGNGHRLSTTSALLNASFNSIGHLRVAGETSESWAPMSGFRPTRDGWVRLHANYPHHASRLLAALEVDTAAQAEPALLERSAVEIEEKVMAAGGVATAVRTPGEWAASAMGVAARSHPWIEFTTEAVSRHRVERKTQQSTGEGCPLAGVRVLDFTRVIAGPGATRLLGALGADVLRVDPPQLPELTEHHIDTGFSKRSAVADLRDHRHLARVRELLAGADVVVLGYRSTAFARFGLDPVNLRADHPHLAVVSVSAWGRTGPWADERGFDSIVQAASGIAHLYGNDRDGRWRPGALPVQALDHATGLGMAAAALALLAARRHGVSGSAHLSLATTAAMLMGFPAPDPSSGPVELAVPHQQAVSDYGQLDFVPPPLMLEGRQLEYMHPPVRYGSSQLRWL
ncbi:CoA transferase [Kribbella sp. NPDC050241]|uniref:CoA transferase n=1 Tax=Kribbella sp. NPDC050241 TaxID=3364115 RepID=UPI0037AE6883